jgi:hypothetical protein
MANVLFWFIITPTGADDPIRTIITSLAAVLTTTMTLRIILGVRGPLQQGGTYSGSWTSQTAASSNQSRSLPGLGSRSRSNPLASKVERQNTYTVDVSAAQRDAWPTPADTKEGVFSPEPEPSLHGVKVTVEQEFDRDSQYLSKDKS